MKWFILLFNHVMGLSDRISAKFIYYVCQHFVRTAVSMETYTESDQGIVYVVAIVTSDSNSIETGYKVMFGSCHVQMELYSQM